MEVGTFVVQAPRIYAVLRQYISYPYPYVVLYAFMTMRASVRVSVLHAELGPVHCAVLQGVDTPRCAVCGVVVCGVWCVVGV